MKDPDNLIIITFIINAGLIVALLVFLMIANALLG